MKALIHLICPHIKFLLGWGVRIVLALNLFTFLQLGDPIDSLRPRISCNSVPRLCWLVAPDSMINVRDPESNVADDVQQCEHYFRGITITSSQNQFQEVTQPVVMLACGDCWPTFTSSVVYFEHTLRDSVATSGPMIQACPLIRFADDRQAISLEKVPDLCINTTGNLWFWCNWHAAWGMYLRKNTFWWTPMA